MRKIIRPIALVFDFGGPVLLTPFEVRGVGERELGIPTGSFAWTGPFSPDRDPDWLQFQAGKMTEREYWEHRVAEFAELTGLAAEMPVMMQYCYSGEEDELVRPQAVSLIRDAKAAGIPVGVLTNDLTAFHDDVWIERMSILREFDVMVDGKRDGVMKPHPDAYRLIAERMGLDPSQIAFLDDQPINLLGAKDVGMVAIHIDPTNPDPGFAEARALFDL